MNSGGGIERGGCAGDNISNYNKMSDKECCCAGDCGKDAVVVRGASSNRRNSIYHNFEKSECWSIGIYELQLLQPNADKSYLP